MNNTNKSNEKIIYTKFSPIYNHNNENLTKTKKAKKALKGSLKMSKKYWGFAIIAAAAATIIVQMGKPKTR